MSEAQADTGALYITALRVTGLKGIKQAEIELEPQGGLIVISGPNGAGKSSLSDAIPWTLASDREITSMPVRRGEERAETFVRLEGPGLSRAYEVRKTILDRDRIRLQVRVDGKAKDEPSPRALLDTFIGDLSFDPFELKTMSEKRRRALFERLVHLPISIGELESRESALYKDRHDAKVLLDRFEAQAAALDPVPADAPEAMVDVRDLLEELSAAHAKNRENDLRRNLIAKLVGAVDARNADIKVVEEEIARLQSKIAEWGRLQAEDTRTLRQFQEDDKAATDVDVSPINARLEAASAVNQAFERAQSIRKRNEAKLEERDEQNKKWTKIDEALQALRRQRREMLDGAEIPVAGLGINDESMVTFKETPFDQCSDGEIYEAGINLAMALNPRMKVIRIRSGTLLDEDMRGKVVQQALDRGYQVFMEITAKHGTGSGFVLEEGEIVSRPGGGVA